jgi:hypothetical protein
METMILTLIRTLSKKSKRDEFNIIKKKTISDNASMSQMSHKDDKDDGWPTYLLDSKLLHFYRVYCCIKARIDTQVIVQSSSHSRIL